MVTLDKAIIATYDRDGQHFELFLDPDNAYLYLEGSKKDLKNILVGKRSLRTRRTARGTRPRP